MKISDNEDAVTVEFDSSRSNTSSLNNVTVTRKIPTDSENSSVSKVEDCFTQQQLPERFSYFSMESKPNVTVDNSSPVIYSRVNHGFVDDNSDNEVSSQDSPYMTKEAAM